MLDLLLSIKNLDCQYGDRIILHNINVDVGSGTIMGLQGRNGCGKSTLMATLAGLLPYFYGTITVNDNYITRHLQPQDIAWIGTQAPFYPQLTVYHNLNLWAAINDSDVHKIHTSLDLYQLRNLMQIYVQELSRGQLQRLALCRLHLTTAKIWLLDEPLTGLDNVGINLFTQHVQRFSSDGGIVIMAPTNEAVQNTFLNIEDYCP